MKIVVDEMPIYSEDCLFCEDKDHLPYYVCKVRPTEMRCPHFSPEWGDYESKCPFLIPVQDLKNNT